MKVPAAVLAAAFLLAPATWAAAPTPDVALLGPEPQHLPVPAAARGIGPGSKLLIDRPDGTVLCTANFLWTGGGKTYLGTAGHCLVEGKAEATHGPGADYDPSKTTVRVCVADCAFGGLLGGSFLDGSLKTLGAVAYARASGLGSDFGVVEVPASLAAELRPAMPVWGGPTTTEEANVFLGRTVLCTYGAGLVTGEVWPTMARFGDGIGKNTATGLYSGAYPSNSGDSGSAVVECEPEGTGGLHGVKPLGVHTHSLAHAVKYGTTVARAKAMATEAGLAIEVMTAS